MNLLICLITYNRLAYTQRTLDNLKKTIDIPHYLVVVDNDSSDGTREWLEKNGPQDSLILNPINFYPGKATNIGWELGIAQYSPTHLMRLDNDMNFSPGWATKAAEYFEAIPPLGQLGLDFTALDTFNGNQDYLTEMGGKTVNMWPGNVGGVCIVPRKLYDSGLRWNEGFWSHDGGPKPTAQEDVKFSFAVHKLGFIYGHATEKLAWTFADESNRHEYPEYYQKTLKERGYV